MIYSEIDVYNTIAQVPATFSERIDDVEEAYLVPSENDRDNGIIERFFISRHSTNEIIEVNYTVYNRIHSNPLFLVVSLIWRISGKLDDEFTLIEGQNVRTYTGVKTANRMSVE